MTKPEIAQPDAPDSDNLSLGDFLSFVRNIKRQSLREVEIATGKEVSNAYLSQLEKGHIKKPSPNILYSLANVYSVPYDTLMEKAGYISQSFDVSIHEQPTNVLAHENLSKKEEEEMLRYLAFIRSGKVKR